LAVEQPACDGLPAARRRGYLRRVDSAAERAGFSPETFRPRAALRGLVLVCDTLWIGIFAALLFTRGAEAGTFLSAAFFIALFTGCGWFYQRLAYTVSERGLTVRSLADERLIAFRDILRVDVLPGLIGTSYAVRTRLGSLQFSSLLAGHERLCNLIVRGAGLSRGA
jgi:hypothetical protein